jgi:hypothetical protein
VVLHRDVEPRSRAHVHRYTNGERREQKHGKDNP